MINLNRVEIIGNLTRDPELRYTPTNQAVASFAVATNRRYKDQGGNWVDTPPEYHEVVVWAQMAEKVNQVLHKGERVFISGRQQTRSWEAQDGSKRYKTELVADTIIGPDMVNKNLNPGDGVYGTFAGGTDENAAESQAGDSVPAGDSVIESAPPTSTKSGKTSSKKGSSPEDEEINIEDIPF